MNPQELQFLKLAVEKGYLPKKSAASLVTYQKQCSKKGQPFSLMEFIKTRKLMNKNHASQIISLVKEQSITELQQNSIAHFQIQKELGRGGMGAVYLAYDKKLERQVALKLILQGSHTSPKQIDRFIQEARATARLKHPHIVSIFEVGTSPQYYFSMEFIEGQTLQQKIQSEQLSPKDTATFLKQISQAISFAHDNCIIHRDIKPSNIMISNGKAKIMDFGLAKFTDSNLLLTQSAIGTPLYMSPEQVSNSEVDFRSDIYSLGATLYEALTGRPPFQANTYPQLAMQIEKSEPLSPSSLTSGTPKDLEAICLKCLEKKREDRYSNAHELAADFENYLQQRPISAKVANRWTYAWKFVKRHQFLCCATLALFCFCVVILLFFLHHHNSQLAWQKQKIKEVKREYLRVKKAKENVQKERENSIKAAVAVFEVIRDIGFAEGAGLQQDKQFLQTLRMVFGELERLGLLDTIVENGYDDDGILYGYAMFLANTEGHKKSIEIFDRIVAKNPKRSVAYFNRGLTLFRQQRNKLALRDISKALEINTNMFIAYEVRAKIYEEMGKYSQAERDQDEMIRLQPSAQVYSQRSNIRFYQKNFVGAEQDLRKAISLKPENTVYMAQLGTLYLSQKRLLEAEKILAPLAARRDAKDPGVFNNLGMVYLNLKKYQKAKQLFNKAIFLDPKMSNAYLNRGLVNFNLSKYQRAEKDFKKALSLNPADSEALNKLGNVYMRKQKFTAATSYYKKAVQLQPNNANYHFSLGQIYLVQGEYSQAFTELTQTIRLNPKFTNAYNHLGYIYIQTKQFPLAIQYLQQAVKISPNFTEGYYNLACVYALQNNKKKALHYLKVLLQKGYRQFAKIANENSFASLRKDVRFKKLINKYKKQ